MNTESKILLCYLMFILTIGIPNVFAEYGHLASEVTPGVFQESAYTFPDRLFIESKSLGTSIPALSVESSTGGVGTYSHSVESHGIYGSSDNGFGVRGYSDTLAGVYGTSVLDNGVWGQSSTSYKAGVYGESSAGMMGYGLYGKYKGTGSGAGVYGLITSTYFISGSSLNAGVMGEAVRGYGVYGLSAQDHGVYGVNTGTLTAGGAAAGVYGNGGMYGIYGTSPTYGVYATTTGEEGKGIALIASTNGFSAGSFYAGKKSYEAVKVDGRGQHGLNVQFSYLDGTKTPSNTRACAFEYTNSNENSYGELGCNIKDEAVDQYEYANRLKGKTVIYDGLSVFDGDLYVEGNCKGSGGSSTCDQDVAESFKQTETLEAGDVVVIDPKGEYKALTKSTKAYDTLVAGVVSTNPTMVMGEQENGVPLALAGVVPTKVTNENGAIEVGDLLTTSSTPGYAMKCTQKEKCFGALIGKALEPLSAGKGTINILVTRG